MGTKILRKKSLSVGGSKAQCKCKLKGNDEKKNCSGRTEKEGGAPKQLAAEFEMLSPG